MGASKSMGKMLYHHEAYSDCCPLEKLSKKVKDIIFQFVSLHMIIRKAFIVLILMHALLKSYIKLNYSAYYLIQPFTYCMFHVVTHLILHHFMMQI